MIHRRELRAQRRNRAPAVARRPASEPRRHDALSPALIAPPCLAGETSVSGIASLVAPAISQGTCYQSSIRPKLPPQTAAAGDKLANRDRRSAAKLRQPAHPATQSRPPRQIPVDGKPFAPAPAGSFLEGFSDAGPSGTGRIGHNGPAVAACARERAVLPPPSAVRDRRRDSHTPPPRSTSWRRRPSSSATVALPAALGIAVKKRRGLLEAFVAARRQSKSR